MVEPGAEPWEEEDFLMDRELALKTS